MRGKGPFDSFAKDNLPPLELQPKFIKNLPELEYPRKLNAAAELLDRNVQSGHADSTAFHFEGGRWSYRDLFVRSNQIANYLVSELGLIPGQRVLLRAPNNPLLVACWFAVLKAGGICVTGMPLLRAKELCYMIEKAKIELCLCDFRFKEEVELARQSGGALKRVQYFGDGSEQSLERLAFQLPAEFSNLETEADDISLIAFTSGTTGKAKATLHTHQDLLTICDCFPKYILQAKSEDIFLGSPPLAFTFGLGGLVLFPMRVAASTVLLEKPTAEALLGAIQNQKASVLFTSPTMYRAMLEHSNDYDLKTLRKCVSAGEALPAPTFEAWRKRTGITIIDGIGSTEMLHIFISADEQGMRAGSTGKVIPGYEACIFSAEGNPMSANEVGLLAVRGPTGCRYLDDLERQKEYVRFGGWNVTGDSYHQDQDGYFYYHCRADDMIISSGYNISGIEVENVLLTHPAVKECAVVGVADEDRGQLVKAFVVLKNHASKSDQSAKDLQDFVKAQIAPYKYPRAIEFVESLPRTESGKLQRFALRSR